MKGHSAMNTQEEEYLTYAGAAQRYGVGESTVRYWVNHSHLKRYKKPLDRKVYLKVSEIEAMRNATPMEEEKS